MRRPRSLGLVGVLLGFVAVLPLGAAAETANLSERATVKVAFNKKLQKSILVDGRGMTLYMYTSDIGKLSSCYADPPLRCTKVWPPLLTKGAPRAGPGAKASLLGVAKRTDDGTIQVTYKGHLLYRLAGAPRAADKVFRVVGDKKPGDVNGQAFLSHWYVLSPMGVPIRSR